ncbi:MAG: phage portal protein, partial [Candidatus Dormibacteria bacterium]
LIKSVAYVHVSPFRADWIDDQTPSLTIEDPLQCYVEMDPARPGRRLAALKRWLDESGYVYAVVYLPDRIYKYRTEDRPGPGRSTSRMRWVPLEVAGEAWPLPNPLNEIFFVPLNNRLRVDGTTTSEIEEAIHIQDGINKELSDMLLASEFGAFPQRWVTNFTLETDPNTGKPIEPWAIGVDRLMIAPPRDDEQGGGGEAETKFGQFTPADLGQWVKAIEHLIQELASISRTPAHYLLGSMGSFPSGESLRAAETGLVTKARERMLSFGEGWEEAIALAFRALKDPRGDIVDSETIWKDPETRTEAEHIDALIKLSAIGVPLQQLWLDAGYSPTQIKRWKRMREEEASWGIDPNLKLHPVGETGPAGPGTPPVPPAPTPAPQAQPPGTQPTPAPDQGQ